MKAPIGIGVLSFAHGHVSLYVEVMQHFPEVRLVAAYDDWADRGKTLCESSGMRYAARVEEVLEDPEIHAVMIGSETSRHEELVVAAAQAGKHILLQKPMAFTLDACDRMIDAINRAGVRFAMAFQMRHDPANQKIREIVHSGILGDLAVVRRRHCIGVCLAPDFINGPSKWHLSAEKNKGMFMDDAVHPADWFHWIFGKPVSVIAEIGNVITDCAPDDNGVAVYRFAKGEMGILFNSSTVMAGENTTEIYGSKGCLIQNYGDGPSCAVPRPASSPALKVFRYGERDWETYEVPEDSLDQGNRIRRVPRPWIDSLLNDAPPPANAEDGRIASEMILGAYRAAEEGRRVTFPL
jgi:predicted dehydrogenase